MNTPHPFNNLQFDSPRIRFTLRWLIIPGILLLYSLFWLLLPPGLIFCLSLLLLGISLWMAGYGWRQAVSSLIQFLGNLERI